MVNNHILSKGLKLCLKDGVKAFHREEKRIKVELQGGKLLAADMVVPAIQVRRDGIRPGRTGACLCAALFVGKGPGKHGGIRCCQLP